MGGSAGAESKLPGGFRRRGNVSGRRPVYLTLSEHECYVCCFSSCLVHREGHPGLCVVRSEALAGGREKEFGSTPRSADPRTA